MKNILLVSLLFAFISTNAQQKHNTEFPKYKTMLNELFKAYNVDDIDSGYIKFEKRKEGWIVCLVSYNDNANYYKKELFWNSQTNEYDSLSFKINESGIVNKESIFNFTKKFDANKFAINQYYNYVGWEMDVIKLLKDETNLSDTNLYSLARAYSSYSSGLLHNNSGLADPNLTFKLDYGENSLSKEQLTEYRKYQHIAIENFNKLAQQNPNFETIIGSINDKASSEYLTSFYNLLIYQNEEEALKELKSDLFKNYIIADAKNYLISCRKNAILFTNGDMDTYPLLYLQAQYNFRTDVKIINLSLLNTDRYVDFVQRDHFGGAIKINIKPSEYRDDINDIVYIIKSREKDTISLTEIVASIKTNKYENQLKSGEKYRFLPTDVFSFSYNDNNIQQELSWKYPSSFLNQNTLILIDILSKNNWARPVHFTTTTGINTYIGMQDYFQLEGHNYYLSPTKVTKLNKSQITLGGVNTSILYDNLMNNFIWTDYNSNKAHMDNSEIRIATTYRSYFNRLAEALINEDKNEKAEIVLDRSIVSIPYEIIPYDFHTISTIECYYKLDKNEKAQEILNNSYKYQKEKLKEYMTLSELEKEAYRTKVYKHIYQIYALHKLTITYKDEKYNKYMTDDNFDKYLR